MGAGGYAGEGRGGGCPGAKLAQAYFYTSKEEAAADTPNHNAEKWSGVHNCKGHATEEHGSCAGFHTKLENHACVAVSDLVVPVAVPNPEGQLARQTPEGLIACRQYCLCSTSPSVLAILEIPLHQCSQSLQVLGQVTFLYLRTKQSADAAFSQACILFDACYVMLCNATVKLMLT